MNYTNSSIRYVFRNLWYIALLSVLPGACLAGMACVEDAKAFFTAFFSGNMQEIGWTQIFNTFSVYNFTGWLPALLDLVAYLVIVLCAAMLLALIDKHMRIGKRTLNGIVGKLNDNVLSTAGVALFFSAVYEIWALLFSSLAYAVFSLVPNAAAQYVLFGILLLAGVPALLYVVALFYLWLPCMQITGFEPFEALRYSNQITEKVKRRLVASMLLSIVIGNIVIVPCVLFLPAPAVYAVLLVVYMFYFMIFTVRMEVVYFDAAQLEREDLKKHYRD